MKTYCDSNAGSQIEPYIWNATESVWIMSPWLGKDYVERLASLSQKGIEVKIITSNDALNIESVEILVASRNPYLWLMVLDKQKVPFPHAKIYIIDNEYAFSGSANFTYSGMRNSVENLVIAETEEEVQKIRNDFVNVWKKFEGKSMSIEELSFGASASLRSIRDALPLSINFGNIDQTEIKDMELVYHPYYFFEFGFRVHVGRSPLLWFEDSGLVVLDGVNRQITNDNLLAEEIHNNPVTSYFLNSEDKYRLAIHQRKIESFQEARELVLNHIIKKNTRHYRQYYGNRSYDRIFAPYRSTVSFFKSGFVQVPVWYCEVFESERRHYQNLIFGASGRKWSEFIFCPECQKKIWINEAINCEKCGTKFCHDCINEKGFVFKKKLCGLCLSQS
jgi:hypothetical protein